LRGRVALALALVACGPAASTGDGGVDGGTDVGIDAPREDAGHDTGVDVGPRCDPMDAGAVIETCNGSALLCDRRFDEVAYLVTHNAMSNAEDRFILPNQTFPIYRQLEDGVRGLMLDVHEADDGTISLCHANCRLGQRRLVDGLRDIREFLDCHPREVLTIIFESYVPESAIAQGFEDSGLMRYVRAQPMGAAWPTLRELIAANERMVVFTADAARTLPWHLYSYDYCWENPYHAETPAELSCAEDRGTRDRSLWIFNHFLTAPTARPDLAEMINHDPFFQEHVDACRVDAGGDLPNFVTVDFYEIGDGLAVVDTLNGV
jgi:hypothetical protein